MINIRKAFMIASRSKYYILLLLFFIVSENLLAQSFNFENKEIKMSAIENINVLGESLKSCCTQPLTGYFRDGFCRTDERDYGSHTVCAIMTQEFLDYTKQQGNDLCTAKPEYNFPGLKAGDKWCLCSVRWLEAYKVDKAPNVLLECTDKAALNVIPLKYLVKKSIR